MIMNSDAIIKDFKEVIRRLRKIPLRPIEDSKVDIDIRNLSSIRVEAATFYSRMRSTLLSISARTKKSEFKKEQLADASFLMRETRAQFEDIRKDIDANKGLVDRIFCLMVLTQSLMSANPDDTVKTELTSAKPKYSKSVTLPKKDTIEYLACLDYFGITQAGDDMGVAKLSWKKVCNHVSELASLGRPIPNFLPKVFDSYAVSHRRKC
jgi:hypothetical protein